MLWQVEAFLQKKNRKIYFEKYSTTNFNNNSAEACSGAILLHIESTLIVGGDSKLTFYNNINEVEGGTVCIKNTAFIIEDNFNVTININTASIGEGMCLSEHSGINFKENSTVIFDGNNATE